MVKKVFCLLCGFVLTFQMDAQNARGEYAINAQFPFGQVHPDYKEMLKDFEPMIGICDCKSIARNPDRTWADTVETVWEWRYVLNGTAIQDENWRGDNFTGSTLRQYNADSAQWYVTFFASNNSNPKPSTWAGGKQGEDIVVSMPQKANGVDGFSRLTFKDISQDGFQWRGEWVDGTGSVVFPFRIIYCKKRRAP